jgi:hypothetical protein
MGIRRLLHTNWNTTVVFISHMTSLSHRYRPAAASVVAAGSHCGHGPAVLFRLRFLRSRGTVRTAQARQESVAFGEMIDTELEMVTLLLLELA